MRRALLPLLAAACTPQEEPDEQPSSPHGVASGPCSETEPHVVSISKVNPDGGATADDELPIWAGGDGGAVISSLGFEVLAPAPAVALVLAMVDEETGASILAGEQPVDPAYAHRFVAVWPWNSGDCSGTIEPFYMLWWPEDFICAIDGHTVRVDSWAFDIAAWPVPDLGLPQATATYVATVDELWDC
jgi:hypothetical protein